MAETSIEWTQRVWNPTSGCDKVSPGCGLPRFDGDATGGCYAMAMAKRLKAMGQPKYQRDGDPRTSGPGFGLTVHHDALTIPLRWRKPTRIFVNSMSDLFHADVPDDFIAEVFAVMALAKQHTFQLLTKRHARMRSLLNREDFRPMVQRAALDRAGGQAPWLVAPWWPLRNVHLGVSVEDQKWADIRIPALLDTPAAVRWLSCEPLLGPVDLGPFLWWFQSPGDVDPSSIQGPRGDLRWVVGGGESGPNARSCDPAWLRSLRDQCASAGVPYFCKQLGAVWGKANGADNHGGDWDCWPEDLRIRQYPATAEAVTA